MIKALHLVQGFFNFANSYCIMNTILFIDFDSTFNQVEALEALLEISIPDEAERAPVMQKLEELTNLGMEGKIDYMESLTQRMKLLSATRADIGKLVEKLKTTISKSIVANKEFLVKNRDQVYIISNGFEDFIKPIIADFGLHEDQVYANRFVYDEEDNVIGVDQDNPLSRGGGKPIVIKSLNLDGRIIMIGDGYNDYRAKEGGAVDEFILFIENIRRESVVDKADKIVESFDEIIEYVEGL